MSSPQDPSTHPRAPPTAGFTPVNNGRADNPPFTPAPLNISLPQGSGSRRDSSVNGVGYGQASPFGHPVLQNAEQAAAPTQPQPASSLSRPARTPSVARPPETLQPAATRARYLGAVKLSAQQINGLIQLFFTNYHQYLPFLDMPISLEQFYTDSPLLFWAIVSVASRRYREYPQLLGQLSEEVPKLVWQTVAAGPPSLSSIQALILISAWSFPTLRLVTNPSQMYCSIAVTAAKQLDMHLIGNGGDRSPENAHETFSEEHCRTWAALNIVSQA